MIRLSLRCAGSAALAVLAAMSLGAAGCTADLPIDGSGGGAAQTSAGSTTSGSAASCTSFPDDAPLGKVTFTVKNNQAAPIYITGPECFRRFSIAASPGSAFQDGERPTSEGTCEHPIPPPLDCLGDTATPIEPGGTLQLEWSGLFYAKPTLASGCPAPTDPQSLECYQGNAPTSGTLEVRVDISPTAENCVGAQNCSATGTLFFAKKTFMYPGEAQVQVDVD
jgi:hypothetical protein